MRQTLFRLSCRRVGLVVAIVGGFWLAAGGACAAAPSTLRIATYNVENFYDRSDDPYNMKDSRVDMQTSPKPARELWALARVIRSVNADVVALQEIENRGFLREYNNSYLEGLGYEHVILLESNSSRHPQGRGIDLAVLSRVPVYSATTYQHHRFPHHKNKEASFSRDFLHVTLRPEGCPDVHIFVVHPMSRRGGAYAHYRRIAEAKEAGRIMAEQFRGKTDAWIIVTGDFNDTAGGASIKAFTSIPEVPLTRVPASDAKDKKFTFYGKGGSYPPSTLDHMLVSEAVKAHLVSPKAEIWNDKAAARAPDHRPVFTTIRRPGGK